MIELDTKTKRPANKELVTNLKVEIFKMAVFNLINRTRILRSEHEVETIAFDRLVVVSCVRRSGVCLYAKTSGEFGGEFTVYLAPGHHNSPEAILLEGRINGVECTPVEFDTAAKRFLTLVVDNAVPQGSCEFNNLHTQYVRETEQTKKLLDQLRSEHDLYVQGLALAQMHEQSDFVLRVQR
jgi:hypothetical protein